MFFMRSFNGLFAIAAIVFAIGCGGSDADSPDSGSAGVQPPSVAELVERVPGQSAQTLDLAAARRPPEKGMGEERWMIESTIARSNADGSHDALYRALDLQSVTAIVRSDGPAPLLLIATKQPWGAAQPRFERAGWKASPDGELLELEYAGPDRGTWYLTGRDGLIVLSIDPRTATDARDGGRGPNRDLAMLIANADGVAAAALTSTTDECVRGFGLGYSPARGGGEISLLVDGPPDAARAKPNGTGTGTGLGYKYDRPAARAERDRVVVPYTKERARNAAQLPMGDIIGGVSHFEYRC